MTSRISSTPRLDYEIADYFLSKKMKLKNYGYRQTILIELIRMWDSIDQTRYDGNIDGWLQVKFNLA